MQRGLIGMILAVAALSSGGCGSPAEDRESTALNANGKDGGAVGPAWDATSQGSPQSASIPVAQPQHGSSLDASKSEHADAEAGTSATPVDASVAPLDARALTDATGDSARASDGSTSDGSMVSDTTSAACSAKPGMRRGKSKESVKVGSATRTFVYYAPKNLDPNRPVPLVIVPHGYTQSGEEMFQITKYPMIADREGFVVMFPDGDPGSVGPWDVGAGVCGNGTFVPGSGDDQAFIDAMIAFASADQCIDRSHIFMTGWSMGGYLSHHSGCLREDLRAIGPHSGGTHDLSKCKTRHKPVIMFHFDPDGLIDYSCGEKARDAWIARNGCDRNQPDVKMVQGGKCAYYRGCPADGQVAFCTFAIPANHTLDFLAGHAWSGGNPHAYSIAETESAAELGWQFFKTYAW